jgi:hypothetical protein
MNDPEPTLRDVLGDQALRQFTAHQRWPQFPATLERLKAHPIGATPQAGLPPPKPKIDREKHADYLESP